ncbi:MAG: hypothetical protein WD355_12545 [Balneolaceae bacterium]
MQLSNKIAIVTGASSGIGAAFSKALIHLLETPDNMLINEIVMRPLNPKPPNENA